MINKFTSKATDKELLKKVYKEAYQEFGIQNLMLLITDDFEMLYVMSESEESYTAINTRIKALLSISKIGFMDILPLEKYVDNSVKSNKRTM